MDWLRKLRFKVLGLWRGRNLEADMAEEMRAHVERLVSANRDAGLSPEEARGRAMRQFGNVASIQEEARDQWRLHRLESVIRDFRYATRQLRGNPGFAVTVIFSLALGIGASVAIFSAVDGILFRDLALPDADHLAVVRKGAVGGVPDRGVAPANALEIVARACCG